VRRQGYAEQPLVTAEFRNLAMLSYDADPDALAAFVPAGTELDAWSGRTFVTVVAFLVRHARLRGVPIPFHGSFEEVNLRFYVRRRGEGGWKRAVVFLRELFPKRLLAWTARRFYGENASAVPLRHRFDAAPEDAALSVSYGWRLDREDASVRLSVRGRPATVDEGSVEEFLAERYFAYGAGTVEGIVEYRLQHPPWRIWKGALCERIGDLGGLGGGLVGKSLSNDPSNVFLAEGSAVGIFPPARIAP
jgi:uncharacterized protein